MFGYPQYGYPSMRDLVKAMKEYEEWEEVKDKKRKERDKEKTVKKTKGMTTTEVFLCLTLLSPIIGPLYLYAVVAAAKHIGDILSQVH